MAMDVTQKFYVFVQAKGGWASVKDAADGCTNRGTKNGIVEKEELYNWLSSNYTDFEAHDFETIWANIDTVQTGNITKGIENLGALDEKEAGNVSSKADKYGRYIEAVKRVLEGLSILGVIKDMFQKLFHIYTLENYFPKINLS